MNTRLHRELLQHFASQPKITVASATFEIVGLPHVRAHVQKVQSSREGSQR